MMRVLAAGAVPVIAWAGFRVTNILWAEDWLLAALTAATFLLVALQAVRDVVVGDARR